MILRTERDTILSLLCTGNHQENPKWWRPFVFISEDKAGEYFHAFIFFIRSSVWWSLDDLWLTSLRSCLCQGTQRLLHWHTLFQSTAFNLELSGLILLRLETEKKKCQLCCLCEGKSQDVGPDLPPNLNAQWQGRLGGRACLVVSTSDHHFLSTSACSHSARLRGHPLPPSWSWAAMPYCAMLRRNDCFIPSLWWLHINRGLMSPLSIT